MSDGEKEILPDETGGLLGRNLWHDPGNKAHPARGVLFGADDPIMTRTWEPPHLWNQLRTSSCTMQACSGLIHTPPFVGKVGLKTLRAYNQHDERVKGYERSKRYDPFPGTSYEGTSTDAPFRLLRAEGRIAGWKWCFGLADVLRTLSHHGAVSIGVWWKRDMFDPLPGGQIRATGPNLGGHAVELYGVNVELERVLGIQSWGRWGPLNGRFWLSWEDLDLLLSEQGEAVTLS